MTQNTKISCPNCGHEFNVEDVLSRQIEEKYRMEFSAKIAEMNTSVEEKERAVAARETALKKEREGIDGEVEKRLKVEAAKKEQELKTKIGAEFESRVSALSSEAEAARKQVTEMKQTQLENVQLKRKLDEQKQDLEIEYEKRLSEKLHEASTSISKRESEKVELKLKEHEVTIDSYKKQIADMQRKLEQGSMQMQGEVQELALEEILRELFPFDVIEEVGKGIKGADVIHTVRNKHGVDCGKILYESKRTKAWGGDWISKLKADAALVKADLCVIVSETLPDDIDRIGQRDGVWICSYQSFKGLMYVLRDSLVRISEAFSSQTNKGEKMQMLYDYLMSNEFRLQIDAIIEGFTSIQESYIKEKRAMERIWKEREKQLERVLLNTNHFIGSIKGIAGSSIENLKLIGTSDNIFELEE